MKGWGHAVLAVVLLLGADRPAALAQSDSDSQWALTANGTLTFGFFQADLENGRDVSQGGPAGSVRLNVNGYYHHPHFLTFELKPQFNLGRQGNEASFSDGRGFSATVRFLPRGAFPLTVSYTRLNRGIISFTNRLYGLEAETSQESLSVNWQLVLKRLPKVSVTYSRFGDDYVPLQPLTSKTENHARTFSVDVNDRRWGWDLNARARWDRSQQQLLNVFDPDQEPFDVARRTAELRVSGRRDLGQWTKLSLAGGRISAQHETQRQPFDLSFDFLNGDLRFFKGQLTGGFRAEISSNLAAFQLQQSTDGALAAPSTGFILVPVESRLRLTRFSGDVQYMMTKDLTVFGRVNRQGTSAPGLSTLEGSAAPETSLLAIQGGANYARAFHRWRFQGSYAVSGGRAAAAITTGTLRGQNANASLTAPSVGGMELAFTVNRQTQQTSNTFLVRSRSWGGGVTVSRALARNWRAEASWNRDSNQFSSDGIQYESGGHRFSLRARHPRAEISVTRHIQNGLVFQPEAETGLQSAAQAVSLAAAFPNIAVIPSSFSGFALGASFRPLEKLQAQLRWNSSSQSFAAQAGSTFTNWDANLGYQFRQIKADLGYASHSQEFATRTGSRRRVYIRIVREFRLF